jgi:hypothetical protein
MIKTGQKPQIDQCLKTVADTHDEIALFDKSQQFFPEMGFHAHGLNDTGAVIIPPAESADKHHDLKMIQFGAPVDEGIDVDPAGIRTGKLKSIGRLMIAV